MGNEEKTGKKCDSVKQSEQIRKEERQRIIRRIDPHFVFNTLGAIRIATKTNADLAYNMVYDLSKYLRTVFRTVLVDENILFSEEAAYILSYANLEKIRFGDGIAICMDIKEEDFEVPPLSVQPLVENAIRHGLLHGRRKGTVTVRSYQTISEYIVQVEDDGTGFRADGYDRVPGDTGLQAGGLQQVRYRVENMADGSVEIKSFIGIGTVITLHIPKRG